MILSQQNKDVLIILALVVLYVLECLFPYFETYQNKTRHTLRNLGLIGFNAVIMSLLLTPLIVFSTNTTGGVFRLVGLVGWGELIATILLMDFVTYVLHVLYHKVPFMWQFHRVHHSDVAMGVTTGARFHIGEHVMSTVVKCGFYAGFGIRLDYLVVYEALFISNVFFHHANISMGHRLDQVYRVLFTSPNMHKVHHSDVKVETDSNYTSLFSVWDRLFGTFCMVDDPKRIVYGIKGLEDEQTVVRMLMTPFKDIETR